MPDIKLNVTEENISIGIETTKTNIFGHVDKYKVLSNAKVLEIEKNTLIQKVTLVWFYYKSKEDYFAGLAPTVSELETIEFPKEHLFQLIQLFYQLQADTNPQ